MANTVQASTQAKQPTKIQQYATLLNQRVDAMNERVKATTGSECDVIKSLQIDRSEALKADKEVQRLKAELKKRTEMVTKGVVNEFYANLIADTFAYRWGYKTEEQKTAFLSLIISEDKTVIRDGKRTEIASISQAASYADYLHDKLFKQVRTRTVDANRVLEYYGGCLARFMSPQQAFAKTVEQFNLNDSGKDSLKAAIEKAQAEAQAEAE